MHTNILNFIERESKDEKLVNRLIVSLFIHINKVEVKNNGLIKSNLIEKNDKDHITLSNLLELYKKHYNSTFTFDNLIELFEFIISPADKIVNGAVYTPKNIREYIVKTSISNSTFQKLLIGDLSCGCGGFLLTTAVLIKSKTEQSYYQIFKNQLYGLDITSYSITRSKILLSLLAISNGEDRHEFDFNLFVGNALLFDWNNVEAIKKNKGFDILIGNPPYVCSRNIELKTKKLLSNWAVNSNGHPDLYLTFFQIGLENLKNNGVLGFISVNTFFKSINGLGLRRYLQENKYGISIIDFGNQQIFKSRTTYTCICIISKKESDFLKYLQTKYDLLNKIKKRDFISIKYDLLNENGWILTDDKKSAIISKIEKSGTSLSEIFVIRSGIATLKNYIYIFKPLATVGETYKIIKNEKEFFIEKAICKKIINTNRITKNNNVDSLYERIIFPYERDNNGICIMEEENIKRNFPNTYKYLSEFKELLSKRDKGKKKYEQWYAFGRNQSLERYKYKLFFPHICSEPTVSFNSNSELLFYNGMAVIHNDQLLLRVLKKFFESRLFWFYIRHTSKPYASGYYSLSKNYIKNIGFYDYSSEDIEYILQTDNPKELDIFFYKKYGLSNEEMKIVTI